MAKYSRKNSLHKQTSCDIHSEPHLFPKLQLSEKWNKSWKGNIYIYIVGQLYFQLHQGKKYGMLLRVSVLTDWGLIHKLPVHAILLKRYGSWNFKRIKINEGYNFKIKTLGPAFSPLKIVWWLLPSCIGEVAKCTSLILYLKPPVR